MLWTEEGSRAKKESMPLAEHPRPQMKRDSIFILNGRWDFEINQNKEKPSSFSKRILVPFAPETPLSGVETHVKKEDVLHYRRFFDLPERFSSKRVFLHLDGVDQIADVYLNGTLLCHHEGGYDPIDVECSPLKEKGNELYVRAVDDTDSPIFPRGKQKNHRGGIWYTPTSGIWQTVWLEATPSIRIQTLVLNPNFDTRTLSLSLSLDGKFQTGEVEVFLRNEFLAKANLDESLSVSIPLSDHFEPWSPSNPVLYDLRIRANEDEIQSYFAFRKFGVVTWKGKKVFGLNDSPLFLHGLLDQGYYPDGGLTPPSDDSMVKDIQGMKSLGFNMLRKHIKIEPMRFYYHCDTLGMVVIQDMVNGGAAYKNWLIVAGPFLQPKWDDRKPRIQKRMGRGDEKSRQRFLLDAERTVNRLYNVPCIAIWTIFNEGWGQFDARELTERVRNLDSSRLIDSTSGWADQGVGDFSSHHIYFRKVRLKNDPNRILSLSEFGGYSLFLKEHSFGKKSFGYVRMKNSEELMKRLQKLYRNEVIPLIEKEGLSISVLTQWSDVEDEVNGLITYDRKALKVDEEEFEKLSGEVCFRD